MTILTYNLHIGYTAVRDLIYRALPTAVLVRAHDRATRAEQAYLAGRPHTDDQYDRVADRTVVLAQLLQARGCTA